MPHSVISEYFVISLKGLAKQGISERKGVNDNYDKSFIRVPRQEEGLRLTEVKLVYVVVKNSQVVSFEHPLTMAIVQRSESH